MRIRLPFTNTTLWLVQRKGAIEDSKEEKSLGEYEDLSDYEEREDEPEYESGEDLKECFDYDELHLAYSGGSILEVMENLVEVGQTMGYNMEGCLGQSAKKRWIQELNMTTSDSFVAIR
ncbi:hypothetical protein Tco_1176143, partial [Tanacetum coccineum]